MASPLGAIGGIQDSGVALSGSAWASCELEALRSHRAGTKRLCPEEAARSSGSPFEIPRWEFF